MASTRKKRKLPTWSHPLLYGFARTLDGLVNIADPVDSMRVASSLGSWYAGLPVNRKRLQRAVDNLQWAFPGWSEEQARDYAIRAYRHLFTLGVEFAHMGRAMGRDSVFDHVELGNLSVALGELMSDQPTLLITGHCGNWELLGATLGDLGLPIHALYRPLDVPQLDSWVRRTRARQGISLVDKFGSAQLLPRLLDEGDPVAFIADQNAGKRGLFVPFFGRLSSAYKTIGLLAMRHRANVICGHAVRQTDLRSPRFQYRVDVVDVIHPSEWDDQPDPLFYITARYRRAIENMVRSAPEQYLWMHRYWKTRPRFEQSGKAMPAQLRDKIAALPWMTDEELQRIQTRAEQDAKEHAAAA